MFGMDVRTQENPLDQLQDEPDQQAASGGGTLDMLYCRNELQIYCLKQAEPDHETFSFEVATFGPRAAQIRGLKVVVVPLNKEEWRTGAIPEEMMSNLSGVAVLFWPDSTES
eukprot:SAG31_NODE_18534_length_632_cov_2.080675_1_plen_111_part_10